MIIKFNGPNNKLMKSNNLNKLKNQKRKLDQSL